MGAACLMTLTAPTAKAAFQPLDVVGGAGVGPGDFNGPRRAAVDGGSRQLYVADSGNRRVQVFTPSSRSVSYLTEIGTPLLSSPYGVAIDQVDGAVYVSDPGTRRIVKLLSDGALVPSFTADPSFTSPGEGSAAGEIGDFAAALAVDPVTRDLVVADPADNLVQRYTANGGFLEAIDGAASSGGTFTGLLDVAVAANGDLLVVDSGPDFFREDPSCCYVAGTSRVVRLTSTGSNVGNIGDVLGAGRVAVQPGSGAIVVANIVPSAQANYQSNLWVFKQDGTLEQESLNPRAGTIQGIALDSGALGRLYEIADEVTYTSFPPEGSPAIQSFEAVPPPSVSINPATGVDQTTAFLSGSVNPNGADATWRFELGTDGRTWSIRSPASDGSAGSGEVDVAVSTRVEGLSPNTTYSVRLIGRSAAGDAASSVETFRTAAAPPVVDTTPVVVRGATSATLRGTVNARGSQTTFWFEYGTDASYGSSAPVGHDGDAGTRDETSAVTARVNGLLPNTTYHYRLVAANPEGTVSGPDRSFVTRGSEPVPTAAGELPDGRAYEQVTPAQKNGYQAGGNRGQVVELSVNPDGNSVTYSGFYALDPAAFDGSAGGWWTSRGPVGWGTRPLLPPPGPYQMVLRLTSLNASLRGSTPDQRTSVYFDTTNTPRASLWLVRWDGSRVRIAMGSNSDGNRGATELGDGPNQPWFEGISDDGRHVVFSTRDSLVPGVPATGNNILYEWVDDGGGGTVRVVNVTDRTTSTILDPGAAELGGSADDRYSGGSLGTRNAISKDGSRVFFQNPAPADDSEAGGPLYLRENGTRTYEISAPERGHAPATEIRYLDASRDGSAVYFWANARLSDDAQADDGIYKFTVNSQDLAFVDDAPRLGGRVPTALASADGARLYYEHAGDVNLAEGGSKRVVISTGAVVAGERSGDVGTLQRFGLRDDRCPSANVSPDGRFFAVSFNRQNGEPQIYRYDASTDSLDHVSTSPTAPDSAIYANTFTSNCNGGAGSPRPLTTRVMSDDGRFVFFDTPVALVPEDTNNRWDAYQWHDGVVSLLGNGTAPGGTGFVGTNATGSDAFFVTPDPLVPQDIDAVTDIYDARIDGGFPATVTRPPCSGDACQAPRRPPVQRGAPASETYDGPGNESEPRTRTPTLTLSRLNAATLKKLARTGKATITLKAVSPGRVTVKFYVRIGGRWKVSSIARKAVRRRGNVVLRLSLSRSARTYVKTHRNGTRVRVEVAHSGVSGVERTAATLRRGKAAARMAVTVGGGQDDE
jgi:hypothetical protein